MKNLALAICLITIAFFVKTARSLGLCRGLVVCVKIVQNIA